MNNKPDKLSIEGTNYIREDLMTKLSFDSIENSKLTQALIGQYVIIRSRNEGVNAGFLEAADETGCILSKARRLWYHKPKTASWYEGVANNGLHGDSKVSEPVEVKAIIEDYSIVSVSETAKKSIISFQTHES